MIHRYANYVAFTQPWVVDFSRESKFFKKETLNLSNKKTFGKFRKKYLEAVKIDLTLILSFHPNFMKRSIWFWN